MDPFYTASTPGPTVRLRHSKRSNPSDNSSSVEPSERHKAEPQPQAQAASGIKSSSAGLRRSTGLFNLKLDAENAHKSENFDASDASLYPSNSKNASKAYSTLPLNPPPLVSASQVPLTPDASGAASTPAPSGRRQRTNTYSLKRPHPFSSGKPAKSGFLSRSSASHNGAASPAGQKRLHLTTSEDDRSLNSSIVGRTSGDPAIMTPELSFRGAKPVQTAFTSAGLQSKKHVPQSPKPRVPETPCKRPMNESLLGKEVSPSAHFSNRTSPHLPLSTALAGHASLSFGGGMSGSLLSMGGSPSHAVAASRSGGQLDRSGSPAPLSEEDPLVMKHPVDRLQRFSIGHLHNTDEIEPPETPTRFGYGSGSGGGSANISQHFGQSGIDGIEGFVHTSTPLSRYSLGAGRQSSEAASTATPGTAIKPRPLPVVLQSVDPADSLSVSPPESLDLDASIAASSSSLSDASVLTALSPRTPDVDDAGSRKRRNSAMRTVMSHCPVESQASPRPRRNIRFLGLRSDPYTSPNPRRSDSGEDEPPIPNAMAHINYSAAHPHVAQSFDSQSGCAPAVPPHVPPLRVETPLGSMHTELSPRTPVSHSIVLSSSNNETHFDVSDHDQYSATSHDTSTLQDNQHPHDALIAAKFDRVQSSAFGEFSAVFIVAQGKQRFAVKRTKRPMLGQPQRMRRREEVDILRTLTLSTSGDTTDGQPYLGADAHVVQLIDEWEAGNFGYIMTEYCENGDLSRFLADQGRISRLEEWRVWKILCEVLKGLAVIHQHDIIHLDLKPANVFVTFEGHLKIGDFGMATRYPVPAGFEREGDREYIAPEVLERQEYGKEADIFSAGLMMVEVAANIVLPDNGVHWHRLRSGDLSDAGRLSSGDLTLANHRSERGNRPPTWAPKFLIDDKCLLDTVVSQMLHPQPEKRPTVEQLLQMPELELVNQRGQAGAVVYEGEYGPEPEMDDEINVWQRA